MNGLLPSGRSAHRARPARILTERFLAWRGFLDQNNVWVDDAGRPTNIGDREGDIRPTPCLLPVW